MAKVQRKFVDGPYGQMHLRTAAPPNAQGAPLVLLHMLPQSSLLFEPLIERLGEERLVIAPDFPGYGESDGPEHPIAPEAYASSIWDLLDALEDPVPPMPIDLFGIHAGAKLGVEVVLARPTAVRKVALSSLAYIAGQTHAKLKEAFTPIPLDTEGTRFREIWDFVQANSGQDITLEQAARSFAEMLRPGEKYAWGNLALLEYNTRFAERLSLVEHHIDLINPGDSLFEQTRATQALITNCTYHERKDWGLMFPWSHFKEFAELVESLFPVTPQFEGVPQP